MKRRLIAAIAAIVLLVAGTAVLLGYVRGADKRALDGVKTVQVLVADELIPEGTPAGATTELVGAELVPATTALDGRVTELAGLSGEVAATELLPGEQLLSA